MPLTLPPEYDAKLRTLAATHNRRLIILAGIWIACTCVGIQLMSAHRNLGFGIVGVSFLIPFLGVIYVGRLAKLQSIALGFVCPLCGESLYEPPHTRLFSRGECPRCKRPIVGALGKS